MEDDVALNPSLIKSNRLSKNDRVICEADNCNSGRLSSFLGAEGRAKYEVMSKARYSMRATEVRIPKCRIDTDSTSTNAETESKKIPCNMIDIELKLLDSICPRQGAFYTPTHSWLKVYECLVHSWSHSPHTQVAKGRL